MKLNEQILRIKKMMGILNEGDSEITWEPLYKFLEPIFGEKYKKAANAFMYMSTVNGRIRKDENFEPLNVIQYKNGITRKSMLLDEEGNSYTIISSWKDEIREFEKISVKETFDKVYEDYNLFIKEMEDDGYVLSDEQKKDIYTMSYSEYRDWRDNFLTRKGYNVSTVSGDNFKDFVIPGN